MTILSASLYKIWLFISELMRSLTTALLCLNLCSTRLCRSGYFVEFIWVFLGIFHDGQARKIILMSLLCVCSSYRFGINLVNWNLSSKVYLLSSIPIFTYRISYTHIQLSYVCTYSIAHYRRHRIPKIIEIYNFAFLCHQEKNI